MIKKSLITLSVIALFASCGTRSGNNTRQNANTFDEGVVINGIRWATRNVDAPGTFAQNPENQGMLFQWNRKKGWNAVDEEVEGWDNSIPTGTTWYAENDPCPEGWRVPTVDELSSLENTNREWTTRNGIYGLFFGTVPYQIFLPIAERRDNNGILGFNPNPSTGHYWSTSYVSGTTTAWSFTFNNDDTWLLRLFLPVGLSIRCVAIN